MSALMEVQTRSDGRGKWAGCHHFHSIAAAYLAWQEDPNIWKISWSEGEQQILRRFRPKRVSSKWSPQAEAKMEAMSPDYRAAKTSAPSAIFWLDQDVLNDDIKTVLRDVDFRAKYCTDN
jgi:hypothetical protein